MPQSRDAVIERSILDWLAEEVMYRFLRDVPEGERHLRMEEVREQLGRVLCTAPIKGDPVAEVMLRADIAAAFAATYRESSMGADLPPKSPAD
jgi:hypothetical protein